MRRGLLLLVALLALAVPLSACGGDDDDSASTTTPSAASEGGGEETGATAGGAGDGGAADAGPGPGRDGEGSGAAPESDGGGAGGRTRSGGKVDLSVDPGRIRGAVVTETGAVQTLPPDEEAQETAQENTYGSIRDFGEEASGEEATNITFALVQYLTAKAEDDWATACARLYSVLRESLERSAEGQGCPEAYGALMSRSSKARRIEQTKIDISSIRRGEGNRAFVIYKTPDTLSADMPMYVEDGVWKVGALEAYALTPDQVG